MKTEIPPKGVTARWVSRRITRSPESRAVISCGTGLSEVFASTPLYRRHLRSEYSSASEFRFNGLWDGFRYGFLTFRVFSARCSGWFGEMGYGLGLVFAVGYETGRLLHISVREQRGNRLLLLGAEFCEKSPICHHLPLSAPIWGRIRLRRRSSAPADSHRN